jgi:hypothetical protein
MALLVPTLDVQPSVVTPVGQRPVADAWTTPDGQQLSLVSVNEGLDEQPKSVTKYTPVGLAFVSNSPLQPVQPVWGLAALDSLLMLDGLADAQPTVTTIAIASPARLMLPGVASLAPFVDTAPRRPFAGIRPSERPRRRKITLGAWTSG